MRLGSSTALALALAFVPLAGGCNDNSFAGGGAKRSAEAKPAKPDTTKPEKPGQSGTPSGPGVEEELGTENPGTPTNPLNPGTDNDEVLVPDEPLVDNDAVVQPNDNEIIFGPQKLFHIGDGALTATSCKEEVTQFDVAGLRYFFEFEVKKPGTKVEIALLKICGVDKPDSNFVHLKRGSTVVASVPVPKGATSLVVPAQTLDVGTYVLEVESRLGSVESPTDADDYLVGNVQVKASAPIRAGQVGAN